jgi:uncharacterized protein YkwD
MIRVFHEKRVFFMRKKVILSTCALCITVGLTARAKPTVVAAELEWLPNLTTIPVSDDSLDTTTYLEETMVLLNEMRIENNLPPVKTAPVLLDMAQQRAVELTDLYAHDRPDGTAWFTVLDEFGVDRNCYAGENIAAGYDEPEMVVEAWMNSPTHRKTILNANYEYFAVGLVYEEDDPDYYGYYWELIYLSSDEPFEGEYLPSDLAFTTTEATTTTEDTTTETTTTETTTETTETTTAGNTGGGRVRGTSNNVNYGDCNLDSVVDIRDAIVLQKYLGGMVSMNATQLANANCNLVDGTTNVDEADSSTLMQFVIMNLDTLPVWNE